MVVAIKSAYNNKYLRFRHEEVQTHSLVQFSGDKVIDPYAQFEVVSSNNNADLCHLKCRYSNKFLVRWSPNHYWISASAEKPDENESRWTCTLFKRIDIEDGSKNNKFRLMHIQLGHYACLWRIGAPFDSCLFAGSKNIDGDSCNVFSYVNIDFLSKIVALKGENGKYLGVIDRNGQACLQFSYDNPNDPEAEHEIFTTPEGIVCIRSNYYEKFWRLDHGDWIVADAEDLRGSNNARAMFRPIYSTRS